MYTQSFNVPDAPDTNNSTPNATLKSVPKAMSETDIALQTQFDACIDADGKVEPRDWMQMCWLHSGPQGTVGKLESMKLYAHPCAWQDAFKSSPSRFNPPEKTPRNLAFN